MLAVERAGLLRRAFSHCAAYAELTFAAAAGGSFRHIDCTACPEQLQLALQDVETASQPAIATGLLSEWPALSWTLEDIRDRCGPLSVLVERSIHGGDYRTLYSGSQPLWGTAPDAALRRPAASPAPGPRHKAPGFEQDVPVTVAQLLDHIQRHGSAQQTGRYPGGPLMQR